MNQPVPTWRAEQIAKLVGCHASDVIDMLKGWRGENLSRMSEREIADAITARLNEFVENP